MYDDFVLIVGEAQTTDLLLSTAMMWVSIVYIPVSGKPIVRR